MTLANWCSGLGTYRDGQHKAKALVGAGLMVFLLQDRRTDS